jgi:hypothetical protein
MGLGGSGGIQTTDCREIPALRRSTAAWRSEMAFWKAPRVFGTEMWGKGKQNPRKKYIGD